MIDMSMNIFMMPFLYRQCFILLGVINVPSKIRILLNCILLHVPARAGNWQLWLDWIDRLTSQLTGQIYHSCRHWNSIISLKIINYFAIQINVANANGNDTLMKQIKLTTENTYYLKRQKNDLHNGIGRVFSLKNPWLVKKGLTGQLVKKFDWSLTGWPVTNSQP